MVHPTVNQSSPQESLGGDPKASSGKPGTGKEIARLKEENEFLAEASAPNGITKADRDAQKSDDLLNGWHERHSGRVDCGA